LKVHKEVEYGQSICVVGSIDQLGNWKDVKSNMRWTEGHVWESDTPITSNQLVFSYKYVILQKGEAA
jgi:hypothetical protein